MTASNAVQIRDAYAAYCGQKDPIMNTLEIPVSGIRSTTSPPVSLGPTPRALPTIRSASPPLSISVAQQKMIPIEKIAVSGRSAPENLAAAERLRMLLQAGLHAEPPAPARPAVNSHSHSAAMTPIGQAFQREYHPSLKFRQVEHLNRGNQDVGERHLLVGEGSSIKRETDGSTITRSTAHQETVYDRAYHYLARGGPTLSDRKGLILPGLGEGRQRNGFGRAVNGGQEIGQGVIGGDTAFSLPTKPAPHDTVVIESENGCDIPMTRDTISGEEFVTTTVSLDPDLPPLAIEHPARVWNSLLHSLSADLQPVIKWEYEKTRKDSSGMLWVAHLTLILPPSHPSIANHPLASTLSKNRYSKEYITAVEVLGGVKSWSGIGKSLKADAQNTTLARCVADDALSWLHDPILNSIPDDEDGNDEAQHARNGLEYEAARQDLSCLVTRWAEGVERHNESTSQNLAEEVHRFEDDASPAAIPGEKGHSAGSPSRNTPESPHIDQRTMTSMVAEPQGTPQVHADPVSVSSPGIKTSPQEPVIASAPEQQIRQQVNIDYPATQTIMKALAGLSEISGASLTDLRLNQPTGEKSTLIGGTLSIGIEPHLQLYEVLPIYTTAADAQEALCQTALNLNVLGFIAWLHGIIGSENDNLADSIPTLADGDIQVAKILRKVEDHGDLGDQGDIDWQNQLYHFCAKLKIKHPKFDYTVERDDYGRVMFIGQVTLGDEQFTAPQTPKSIPAYKKRYPEDDGGRGDSSKRRGGGSGYRGRGKGGRGRPSHRG